VSNVAAAKPLINRPLIGYSCSGCLLLFDDEFARTCQFVVGRRPATRLMIAMTIVTKRMIFAIPAALAARPKNPNSAAMAASFQKHSHVVQ